MGKRSYRSGKARVLKSPFSIFLLITVLGLISYSTFLTGKAPEKGFIPAAVVEVIDGDTIHVRLPDGREEKVRFIGVNSPESLGKVEPYGKEAAAYTKKRLGGRTVYLELDVGERDKYGRLLAYVWLERPQDSSESEVRSKMFNAELLLNGYAQVMTVPPNVKYAELFSTLQKEAREERKGLWGIKGSQP